MQDETDSMQPLNSLTFKFKAGMKAPDPEYIRVKTQQARSLRNFYAKVVIAVLVAFLIAGGATGHLTNVWVLRGYTTVFLIVAIFMVMIESYLYEIKPISAKKYLDLERMIIDFDIAAYIAVVNEQDRELTNLEFRGLLTYYNGRDLRDAKQHVKRTGLNI